MIGIYSGFIFLWLVLAGIVFGLLYEAGLFIRRIFNFNTIITIVTDFVVFCIMGLEFFYAIYFANNGIVTWYEVLGFFVGFLLERLSVGKMLANILNLVYNVVRKLISLLKKIKLFKKLLR